MQLRLIQIDAFAEQVFRGNPAAVMPLAQWLPDSTLQNIAAENNLSETAFLTHALPDGVDQAGDSPAYHLRWFTPAIEVDLCGHATLAAAGYLFDDVHPHARELRFWSRSGWLTVVRGAAPGELTLDFPSGTLVAVDRPAAGEAVNVEAKEQFQGGADLILVVDDEAAVRAAKPDFIALRALSVRGVAVTAAGDEPGVDFVSRWFGAQAGSFEDPVTGSAHCDLAPLWAHRLDKKILRAAQLSPRGGAVVCEVTDDRVRLTGSYRRFLDGMATIPDLG